MNKRIALLSFLSLTTLIGVAAVALSNSALAVSNVKNAGAVAYENVEYVGYRKTGNTNMLVTGAKVIIIRYTSGYYYASTRNTFSNSGYQLISTVEVTPVKDTYIASYDDYYTIHRNNNQYAFQTQYGEDTYLSLNGKYIYTDSEINYFNVSISSGNARIQKGTRYITFFDNIKGFVSETSTVSGIHIYIDADSVLQEWITNYMHMEEDVPGQCNTYFPLAKAELLKYDASVIADLVNNDLYNDVQDRYESWAAALHEEPYEE